MSRAPFSVQQLLRLLSVPRLLRSAPVRALVGDLGPKAVFGITATFWVLVAFMFGAVWGPDRATQQVKPADVAESEQQLDRTRAAGDGDLRELLVRARGVVGGQAGLVIRMDQPELTVRYVNTNETPRTIYQAPGTADRGIDENGQAFTRRDACWQPSGQTSAPDPVQLILPLFEESARFSPLKDQDGKQVAAFTAKSLGAYGPGRGELVFSDTDVPEAFTYKSDAGEQVHVTIDYAFEPDPIDFMPEC